jgi:putative Ca2+/H+ antiporter (TMEM165/GDT1 family)
METLLPVFVAVLLAETGGRVQQSSHSLQLRFASPSRILAGLAISTLASLLVAAIGGIIVAGLISFDARTLLAGLALLVAGAPMALRTPAPKEAGGKTPFVASLAGFVPLQFGDASQFIVFAFVARTGEGALAIAAGLAATSLASAFPILFGRDWPGTLPIRLFRRIAALLLVTAGSWMLVSALGLI